MPLFINSCNLGTSGNRGFEATKHNTQGGKQGVFNWGIGIRTAYKLSWMYVYMHEKLTMAMCCDGLIWMYYGTSTLWNLWICERMLEGMTQRTVETSNSVRLSTTNVCLYDTRKVYTSIIYLCFMWTYHKVTTYLGCTHRSHQPYVFPSHMTVPTHPLAYTKY